ncbi:MAG: HesA/MoeB/ThiF family protein [Marinovum sp.]|nr:HesA/MoeB/ThiF family protein [Marinovum sp.]
MSRYTRQEVLPEIGSAGQSKLSNAHALVIGAGGLGVPVLQYLAGAGVSRITIVDGDAVSESNLHRQPLYRMTDIDRPKAKVAKETLAALNPEIMIDAVTDWFTPKLGKRLVATADIVLDCADTFAASFTASDLCRDTSTPLVAGSVLGRVGYVLGCCGTAPSLRAIFPELPSSGATCATAGVMGPLVGMLGSLQAQMALSVLLDLKPSPLGQLLRFDAASWRMGGFRFEGAPEPDRTLPFVDDAELSEADHIIDLRAEVPQPFDPRAIHIPPDQITSADLPSGRRIVLACRSGLRAHNTGQALAENWPGEIALLAVTDPNR